MTFRIYDKLCEDAKKLRTEVFVAEQGFETEFDDTDSKACLLYTSPSPRD